MWVALRSTQEVNHAIFILIPFVLYPLVVVSLLLVGDANGHGVALGIVGIRASKGRRSSLVSGTEQHQKEIKQVDHGC